MSQEISSEILAWSAQQWGSTQLGDQRRTNRAVTLGAQFAAQPAASIPRQTGSWAATKAAYLLLNEKAVTHAALSQGHWEATRQRARLSSGVVLFIQDGTELDYTHHPATSGLGRLNEAHRQGFLLHSCLAVHLTPGELGLAAQKVWHRAPTVRCRTEEKRARSLRANESDVWAETLQAIGRAPARESGVRWVSVGDRASDIYGYLRQAQVLGWDVVARACQDRVIYTLNGERQHLMQWARRLPAEATKEVSLRGRDGKPKRTVQLQVAWGECEIQPPHEGKERGGPPLRVSVVRCWEAAPAASEAGLEWILVTSLVVRGAAEALTVIEWYEHRWLIEEYHKCLKTGCALEQRQLTTAQSLQACLGFLALIAVRLLQLRETSRQAPEAPARQTVEADLLETVQRYFHLPPTDLTVRELWRLVARLGGFLARKSDGEPGWQTLWRGWLRLQDLAWRPTG
jgi:hypothetical protein